jgi:F1F0 ATPase subunit 2
MMPDPISVIRLLAAGAALGMVFFGGLWLTLLAFPTARHPLALALGSFWGRTALVIAVFAFVLSGGVPDLLICLAGFIGARLLLARWLQQRDVTGPTVE